MARKGTKVLGGRGEDLAARLLEGKGYRILSRNLRTKEGEIDLLAQDGETMVFVEVRTRRSRSFGTPQESIIARKKSRLINAAESYLESRQDLQDIAWRIDVVAIELTSSGRKIDHIQNAVIRDE